MAESAQKHAPGSAAAIAPLASSFRGKRGASGFEGSKENVKGIIDKQVSNIEKLAQKYFETGDDKVREELNRQNLYLHGEIQVFARAFGGPEARLLLVRQDDANDVIEVAAKKWDREVTWVNINDITTSDKKTASHHIHDKLFHPGTTSVQKLLESVEEGLLRQLYYEGFDEVGLFDRLFTLKLAMHGRKSSGRPAAQIEGPKTQETKDNAENQEGSGI